MRALLVASVVTLGAATPAPPFSVIVLPPGLRGMMSAVWIQNNRHWDELAGQNTLTQLLGTGRPTQREYLGCLAGEVANDTLWVRELQSAADLKQLQFAVAGNCDQVDRLVGTWHTHPYRAGPDGRALKERGLSPCAIRCPSARASAWGLRQRRRLPFRSDGCAAPAPTGGSARSAETHTGKRSYQEVPLHALRSPCPSRPGAC